MTTIAALYDEKKYPEIIFHAKEYLTNDATISKQDAIAIIKTLLRYEFDEAAYLFFEKYKFVKGIETPTIATRIADIKRIFSEINHSPKNNHADLRTTSEIYLSDISRQQKERYRLKTPANLLLVIDSLGPGGAERQFVTLLNHLISNPPSEIGEVYGLVLTNDKINSEFYLQEVLPEARKNLITPSEETNTESQTSRPGEISFGNKSKKDAVQKIRNAIKTYNIDAAMGFLEETSINVCIAALYENRIGMTRFGSLPNIIGREIEDDLRIKYSNRLKLLSVIDSPNIVWGANSQRCLNKYLLHSSYSKKVHAKRTFIIPNIVNLKCAGEFSDSQFEKLSGKIIIISIMRLSQEKRPSVFVDLCRKYKNDARVHFVLIGDGPLRQKVEEAQKEDIPLHWIKNTDRVNYYLNKSDIYLMTSIVEGSPNAVIESSYCGLPAVIADVGGVSETYTHLKNAVFVDHPQSVDSYKAAIDLLIENDHLRTEIASNAKARVIQRHSGISTNAALGITLRSFAEFNT